MAPGCQDGYWSVALWPKGGLKLSTQHSRHLLVQMVGFRHVCQWPVIEVLYVAEEVRCAERSEL